MSSSVTTPSVRKLEARLAEHMTGQHILDMLTDTEHWLHWTSPFGPISGHETKLEDVVVRHLATVFCYGTNMGPSQAARSLDGLDRRQIEWINQHHVVEDGLDEASTIVVNGYYRFLLTRAWGSGKHVSADGTQWDTYERNLLAERHIRYGGFGGIAYYHISDLYIALFNHFIPCGAYEGVRKLVRCSGSVGVMPPCPTCQHLATKRNGRDRRGRQKYTCRPCGCTFTENSSSAFSGYRWPRNIIVIGVR